MYIILAYLKNIWLWFVNLVLAIFNTDQSKEIIKNEVTKLLNHNIDGITPDLAYVMLEAITRSDLNNVTPNMVSKALKTLKDEISATTENTHTEAN